MDDSQDGNGMRPALDLGWGKIFALMVWGFVVLAFAAGGLADVTNLWWLVLVFEAAVPVLLVMLRSRTSRAGRDLLADHEGKGERELLDGRRSASPPSASSFGNGTRRRGVRRVRRS